MNTAVEVPMDKIKEFCRKRQIAELSFFGSILRDDFTPDSDVDVLVRFAPETHYGMFDLVEMELELQELLGRKVDLIEREAIEQTPNYIRRREILSSAEVVYAA